MTLVVTLARAVLSAKFNRCCWRNPWCDGHVTHTPKCCLCFPCAAYELRQSLDLVLLTKLNGRYFYKMHLATLDKPTLLQNLEIFALQIQSKSVTLSEILKYTIVRANTN